MYPPVWVVACLRPGSAAALHWRCNSAAMGSGRTGETADFPVGGGHAGEVSRRRGLHRARRRQGRIRGVRRRRAGRGVPPDRRDRALPLLEGAGAVPGPDARRWSRSTRGGTAGPTGRERPQPTPTRSSSPTRSRSWTRRASTGRSWSGMCTSGWRALLTAGQHPDRVLGVVAMSPWAPFLTPPLPHRVVYDFDEVLDTEEGWAKDNRHYWLRTGAGTPSSSSASCCASRIRPSSRRTASAGPWRSARRRCCCTTTGR